MTRGDAIRLARRRLRHLETRVTQRFTADERGRVAKKAASDELEMMKMIVEEFVRYTSDEEIRR